MTGPIPLAEQVACVRREIRLRRRTYPRWVNTGRMTAAEAAYQLAAMEAALATLEKLAADAAPGLFNDSSPAQKGTSP